MNGTATFGAGALVKRGLGAAGLDGADVNVPPYTIHNGNEQLSTHTVATNATHAPGYLEFDTHNLWGMMEEKVGGEQVGLKELMLTKAVGRRRTTR